MSNRDLLRQFADGTPLGADTLQRLMNEGYLGDIGEGRLMLTTAGRIVLGQTLIPPGDSASCPDDDSYLAPRPGRNSVMQVALEEHRSALNVQEGGDHYKNLKVQPVEFIEANGIPFLEGCVIKRMCRHGSKAKAEDLRKAIHEIKLLLELRYGEKL